MRKLVVTTLLSAACSGLFSSCATQKVPAVPARLKGVQEYNQIIASSRAAILKACQLADQVAEEPWPVRPKVVSRFSKELERLQVGSIRVRARVQAIHARGDAYFADWSQAIQQINDPKVRELAERFHPQLQDSYTRIKVASKEAGDAFRLFLGTLRALRTRLEPASGTVAVGPPADLIRNSREQGEAVLRILDVISNELQAVTRRLTPVETAASHESL